MDEAVYEETDAYVFRETGSLCLRPEAELEGLDDGGSSQRVACSDRFGLVVFADALGASPAAAERRAAG